MTARADVRHRQKLFIASPIRMNHGKPHEDLDYFIDSNQVLC